MPASRRTVRSILVFVSALPLVPSMASSGLLDGLLGGSTTPSCTPLTCGRFGDPFVEPAIAGQPTAEKCIAGGDGMPLCKPAAGSMALLADGRHGRRATDRRGELAPRVVDATFRLDRAPRRSYGRCRRRPPRGSATVAGADAAG